MENNLNNKDMPKKTSLYQRTFLILSGLLLTIVILEITLRIGGFTILSLQEHRNLQSIKQKGSFRIMCLGESTTQNQYPPYLEEILNKHNIGIKFTVIDKGMVGITTRMILAQLEANLDKYQPDMVITMIGCNDSGIVYYKDIPEANAGLFQHCRAYRFGQLIYMHILNKLKKEGLYGLNDSSSNRKIKSDSIGDSYQNNKELIEKEQILKKILKFNPKNDSAYIELGKLYIDQGKLSEVEQAFYKAIELNPNNDSAYTELGRFYRDQGDYREAEPLLNVAIELNPKNDSAYAELGKLRISRKKLSEAEQAFNKAIELNPKNDSAYKELDRLYREYRRFDKLEQLLKKAIEINPKNDSAYTELGRLYREYRRFDKLEQLLKKAIEINPKNDSAYKELSQLYRLQGKFTESEQMLKNTLDRNPKNDFVIGGLNEYYNNPKTVNNYHKIKQILDKRNIKLVCVQYPMRNIMQLERIFKESEGSIIFVDNARIFKDAVRKKGYGEYFTDVFAGDFGHCTKKGNRLLAENIADAILKEVFGK